MVTKKPRIKAVKADAPIVDPLQTPADVDNDESNSEVNKTARFSFSLTGDNKIDFESMRSKTKAQLAELLRDPLVIRELGFAPEAVEATLESASFGEDEANALLDLLGVVNSFAAHRIFDVPHDITTQAFTFTPDHRRKLTPVYARLLNKWGPSFLKQYKDELGAAVLTATVLNVQVQKMRMLDAQRKQRLRPTAVPRTQPEPMPVDATPEEIKTVWPDNPVA